MSAQDAEKITNLCIRTWTRAQHLSHELKITQRQIAEQSGVDLSSVNRVLIIQSFRRVKYESVIKVRQAFEHILSEIGVCQINFKELWDEYDQELRPRTKIQALLRNYKITHREIAEQSGVNQSYVGKALSIKRFNELPYVFIIKVRRAVELLLPEEKCNYRIDFETLWNEYDAEIEA